MRILKYSFFYILYVIIIAIFIYIPTAFMKLSFDITSYEIDTREIMAIWWAILAFILFVYFLIRYNEGQ